MRFIYATLLILILCTPARAEDTIWQPTPGTTWQWQLTEALDTTVDAAVYDIDLFDHDAATVAALQAAGRKVICYISVGSWEDWRPDAADFPESVIGNDYEGWAGEKWLDIRQIDLLAPIMRERLDLCAAKGFDGIEPDNMDSYTNDTGFPLTYADQLAYNLWLADEAHARGLSIGMKNTPEMIDDLLPHYDWALTEDCFDQGWCADMSPFIDANKAVFAAEYTDTGITLGGFCPQAAVLRFSAILKHRNLDAARQVCPNPLTGLTTPRLNFVTTSTFDLTWNGVPWAAGYEFQLDDNASFRSVDITRADLSAADLSITLTLGDGTYYWRVRARRADNTVGAWSAASSVTVVAA